MKVLLIIVVSVLTSFNLVLGQEEFRKPTVEIYLNGKMYSNGDEITVQKGQSLDIKVVQEGGRRDFVKFPDNYVKISPDFQVLSRGSNRLVFVDKGVKSEWKLLSEDAIFSSDKNLTINKSNLNANEASIRVGIGDFGRTYLKIDLSTIWQLTADINSKSEKNSSEAIIYFNVAGATDTWFVSKNIHAKGMNNDLIRTGLEAIQSNFDSIESQLFRMKYAQAQQEIRKLQSSVNSLNSIISQVKARNIAYQSEIHFIGLPTDQPVAHLKSLEKMQQHWASSRTIVVKQLQVLNSGTPNTHTTECCTKYLDWQYSLPENWLVVFGIYLPHLSTDKILLPGSFQAAIEEGEFDTNNQELVGQLSSFLNQRASNIPIESQQIAQLRSRMQAVKIFDGMLRSYISSINWAEWENTRGASFVSASIL